jgi:FtsP/CotA-like multicopper oxidase with cupredoxin domain
VPHVTQPPIEPGETFVYEFVLKDAGTFWYHPHLRSSEQVERGLHGILVVEDEEPPPYDQDVVWALDDWRLGPDGAIDPAFNTRHDLAHDGRWGNVLTVNGSVYERLVVRPGERIRLRLLDVANGRVFAPDFSGLDAQVIAVDGLYTARPLTLDRLELAPGNRLDLDIRFTAAQRGKTFTIVDRFTRRPLELATIVVADVEPVSAATFPSPAAQHVPRWHDAAALAPNLEYRLNARRGGDLGIEWTMNDVAFTHADHAAQHPPSGSLALGQFSKVRFVNQSARIHPMHLHGTFFRLLARNGQPVDEPFFRDTVLLRARESVDIGLVPLDEGRWMVHCHILEHAESGMMTLIAVEPAPDTQPL